MGVVFGGDFDYERGGLVLVSLAMGLYLSAATDQPGAARPGPRAPGGDVLGGVGRRASWRSSLAVAGERPGAVGGGRAARRARRCLCTLLYTLYRRA